MRVLRLLALAPLMLAAACGGNVEPSGTGGSGGSTATTTASSTASTTNTASTSTGGIDPDGCTKAGGMCSCFGSCNPGYHQADAPLVDACPQPCPMCGGCAMGCCLPDLDGG